MCQEKVIVREFGEEVVLCCDLHLTSGFHFDQLNNIEWRVPSDKVPAKKVTVPPLHEKYVHTGPPNVRKLAHVT